MRRRNRRKMKSSERSSRTKIERRRKKMRIEEQPVAQKQEMVIGTLAMLDYFIIVGVVCRTEKRGSLKRVVKYKKNLFVLSSCL